MDNVEKSRCCARYCLDQKLTLWNSWSRRTLTAHDLRPLGRPRARVDVPSRDRKISDSRATAGVIAGGTARRPLVS